MVVYFTVVRFQLVSSLRIRGKYVTEVDFPLWVHEWDGPGPGGR